MSAFEADLLTDGGQTAESPDEQDKEYIEEEA